MPGHHSRDYGQLMPMGTTKGLTAGQLEYVRRWIEAGAPRAGHVVDTAVLADARLQSSSFTPLAAPTAAGLQLSRARCSRSATGCCRSGWETSRRARGT